MKLQILFHSRDADSAAGYEAPCDVSELLLETPFQGLEELKSILKAAGFALSPYSFFYGGHPVDDLKYDDARHIRHGTILAVPKDPIVRVFLPTGQVWKSSIKRYEGAVKDLKSLLKEQNLSNISPAKMLLVDLFGKIFDDEITLRSAGFFDDQNAIICRQQLEEYTVSEASDRLAQSLKVALASQQQWCSIGDLSDECECTSERLISKFDDAVADLDLNLDDATLHPFTFDRFEQDFPPENAPRPEACQELVTVKGQFLRRTTNSRCPASAQQIIDALITKLSNTNIDLAKAAAKSLGPLVQSVFDLACKDPFVHDHNGNHDRLKVVERALNNYRDIMAWKLYADPSEHDQREASIRTLREVQCLCSSVCILDLRFARSSSFLIFSVHHNRR
jgi:hypothetical protein